MTESITIGRRTVAKLSPNRRSAKPATVSAAVLALHLDCGRTYIGKLEAEGVIQRQGDGFQARQSGVLPTCDTCGVSGGDRRVARLTRPTSRSRPRCSSCADGEGGAACASTFRSRAGSACPTNGRSRASMLLLKRRGACPGSQRCWSPAI